jgi:hypothetical protein
MELGRGMSSIHILKFAAYRYLCIKPHQRTYQTNVVDIQFGIIHNQRTCGIHVVSTT